MVIIAVADAGLVAGINATILSIGVAVAGVYLASLIETHRRLRQELLQELSQALKNRHEAMALENYAFPPPTEFMNNYDGTDPQSRGALLKRLSLALSSFPIDSRSGAEVMGLFSALESQYPFRSSGPDILSIGEISDWIRAVNECYIRALGRLPAEDERLKASFFAQRLDEQWEARQEALARLEVIEREEAHPVESPMAREATRRSQAWRTKAAMYETAGESDLAIRADWLADYEERSASHAPYVPSFRPLEYFLEVFSATWEIAQAAEDRLFAFRVNSSQLPKKGLLIAVGVAVLLVFGAGVVAPVVAPQTPAVFAIWLPAAFFAGGMVLALVEAVRGLSPG